MWVCLKLRCCICTYSRLSPKSDAWWKHRVASMAHSSSSILKIMHVDSARFISNPIRRDRPTMYLIMKEKMNKILTNWLNSNWIYVQFLKNTIFYQILTIARIVEFRIYRFLFLWEQEDEESVNLKVIDCLT
jgi:hypothetical protein